MDQVFPSAVENVDVVELYATDDRPPPEGRPWVVGNMIASIDGAIAVNGLSGGLGGPADKSVFSAIRGVADIIVAASGTVISENYRRPQTPERIQQMRVERGQTPFPRLAIVSGTLSIDADHRVFDPDARPLIITHRNAPDNRRDDLADVADVVEAGEDRVDIRAAMVELSNLGARCVLVEGGPTLNAAFVVEDLFDEFCLSASPLMVGGSAPRVVDANGIELAHPMTLERVLHEDGFLFHRYVRNR